MAAGQQATIMMPQDLTRWRVRHRLRPAQLADLLHVPWQTVSAWERGQRPLPVGLRHMLRTAAFRLHVLEGNGASAIATMPLENGDH